MRALEGKNRTAVAVGLKPREAAYLGRARKAHIVAGTFVAFPGCLLAAYHPPGALLERQDPLSRF